MVVTGEDGADVLGGADADGAEVNDTDEAVPTCVGAGADGRVVAAGVGSAGAAADGATVRTVGADAAVRAGDGGAGLTASVVVLVGDAAGRAGGAGVDGRDGVVAVVVGIGAVLAAAFGDVPLPDVPLPEAADEAPEDDASPVAEPGREVPFGADPGRNT